MVHGNGQMSDAELAAFAEGSLSPPARLRARIRPEPSRPRSRPRARLRLVQLATASAKTIVSRVRAGHTCVLSGVGLRSDELLELAAWNGSIDIARIHTGLLPPLVPAVHRPAP
jgi:hypothetical protein